MTQISDLPEIDFNPMDMLVEKEPLTVICSEKGWIRAMKGHLDLRADYKFKEGDATMSEKHCNFFVNNGKAKSSDIEKLIDKVRKTVNTKTGIKLELEIKIIGE